MERLQRREYPQPRRSPPGQQNVFEERDAALIYHACTMMSRPGTGTSEGSRVPSRPGRRAGRSPGCRAVKGCRNCQAASRAGSQIDLNRTPACRLMPLQRPLPGVGRCHQAGLLPGGLRTAQTDRDLEGACEEALDHQAGHAADHRQIRNQCRQLRAELGRAVVGQRRERDRAAVRTLPAMAAVLGDVRGDRRQLRDLMTARLAERMPGVQASRAMATRLGREVDDHVHALEGHQRPMVSRMARLSTGFAATFPAAAACPLLTRETIGGRRLRREGGILLLERELALEIGNPLGVLLEQLAQALVLFTQPFDVRRLALARPRAGSSRRDCSWRPRRIDESVRNRYRKYKYKAVPRIIGPELLRAFSRTKSVTVRLCPHRA
jgi:hypothetical protein